jgi:hypothetical protein
VLAVSERKILAQWKTAREPSGVVAKRYSSCGSHQMEFTDEDRVIGLGEEP